MSDRFADLDFEGFRSLARDSSLSPYEKVGFPDSYRAGKERVILRDIGRKLRKLSGRGHTVLDVGPGCSPLATALIALCAKRRHRLLLVDSPEMLDQLPEGPALRKLPGRFPDDCAELIAAERGRVDAILVYSVLQYVFAERDIFAFVDRLLELLAPEGALLCGDIPNWSMRRRFFASASGEAFHRRFTGSDDPPHVALETPPGHIDDAVLLSLVMRARGAGFQAFLLPQDAALPMANRREDLLVIRP